ncbi:NADP-dependent oxidoreductase [Salinicola corii]|uniref:NADP-dependent oxidoreductase n=1 Tax=Salinicola corii TaxID=2606937 RepID=A0A640WCS6_9GAMM|nr:NADP-dependent oxidoreductase [Salinicola corii]KAA0017625.1 NADP-dependent oxidoreductase [Salinicola corii]
MTSAAGSVEQLFLRRMPQGPLQPDDIGLRSAAVDCGKSLRLEPHYFSVDPYMRNRMQPEGYDYIARWQAGSMLSGWALARVRESQSSTWRRGDWALGHLPMQTVVEHDGAGLIHYPASPEPPLAGLHPLGMTGFTAWLGMCHIGRPLPSDTVLVGAAAGAVGSLAAQWARRAGAQVIVTAGRREKREWLKAVGFERVLDHRAPDYAERLRETAPDGITLNFESLGGSAFEIANTLMRPGGRVVLCGLISQYQQPEPRRAPANLARLGGKGVGVHPFVAPEYLHEWEAFQRASRSPVAAGELVWRLDIVEGGLAAVPQALIGLLAGGNLGKRIVKMDYC